MSMITSNWVATWPRIKVRAIAIVKPELLELHLLVKGIASSRLEEESMISSF